MKKIILLALLSSPFFTHAQIIKFSWDGWISTAAYMKKLEDSSQIATERTHNDKSKSYTLTYSDKYEFKIESNEFIAQETFELYEKEYEVQERAKITHG